MKVCPICEGKYAGSGGCPHCTGVIKNRPTTKPKKNSDGGGHKGGGGKGNNSE